MLAPALLALGIAAAPVKVATTGWLYVGIDERLGEVFLDRFVTQLARGGRLSVVTQRDIQQVLGLERQKALSGCSESSCLAELAGALGVDMLLTGSLAKTGAGYTVTVRVRQASDATVVASVSERLKDDEALQDWLDAQAEELSRTLASDAPGSAPPASVSRSGPGVARFLPGVAGLVLLGVGAACFVASKGAASELRMPAQRDPTYLQGVADRGRLLEASGLTMMIAGGAGVVASLVWLLIGPSNVSASVAVGPGSAALAIEGRWP